jgi:crotonobetainyl-CoA:carnitine CoA-transferase CaiB-like acyl-CoA transferase
MEGKRERMMDYMNRRGKKPMPLEGITVVEYAVFHAGPGAGAILGDLGADVIKIENGVGDPERHWNDVGGMDLSMPDGQSVVFQSSNRNKKSICLDIRKRMGREIFVQLIKEADVFLTNLRKSTKFKMGIDYASVAKINPKIIHANVSGYGPEGPVSDQGAYDPMGQARSGMMFATGGKEPVVMSLAVLDQATTIAVSHAILTALFFRERHGVGQEVHVSLYSTALWLMYINVMMIGSLGIDPSENRDRSLHSPLRNRFCCKDGKWLVGAHHPEERYWPSFCEATGRADLLEDPRLSDDMGRREHCRELIALFDEVFSTKKRDEWLEILVAKGLMFCPVQDLREVFKDPQALINKYVVNFEHPTYGTLKIPGYPVHFSAARAETQTKAPALGEHTNLIMRRIGYSEGEIHNLKAEGVIR